MRTLARPEDKTEIVRRLGGVRPESPRRWGRMSAHQMVCHLADGYRMALGEQTVTSAGGVLQRTLVKWIALYAPLPWPAGIPTSPEIDQQGAGTPPSDFGGDVERVAGLLDLVAERRSPDWPRHPVFGRMSGAAWLRWGYLHADHHLRQFGV